MATVVQSNKAVVRDVAIAAHDWINSRPFFHWKWSLLDVAVIALLVLH
jgi:hypothetical protein